MYFVFFVMPLLSAIKVTTQGKYAQKNIRTFSDLLLYNAVVFFATALILSAIFLRTLPPVEVLFYALIGCALNILFQTTYTLAFQNGPITPTVIINSFSIVLVLIAGRIFFNEQWSVFTIIGFALMSVAFYHVPARGENKKINVKWMIFTLLAFLFGGGQSVLSMFFARSDFSVWKSEFLVLSFALSSVVCILIMPFGIKVKKEPITIKADWKLPIVTLVISSALGVYNLLNIYAFQWFESYIASPIISGSIIVVVMVINSILNRQWPTIKSLIGTAFAIAAIVFLNL